MKIECISCYCYKWKVCGLKKVGSQKCGKEILRNDQRQGFIGNKPVNPTELTWSVQKEGDCSPWRLSNLSTANSLFHKPGTNSAGNHQTRCEKNPN